jgi:hypothetical protein
MTAKRRRTILGAGVLIALLYALWRVVGTRQRETGVTWQAQPFPMPPRPVPTPAEPWVEAVDGACPASHPVKGKLSSGIFHAPGGQMYDRTRADRCYVDPEAAVADGLRASKR